MPRLFKAKTEPDKLYEINILSAYVSKILISLAEDTNNKHLINNETINRCQKLPKDYMMGNGIITTIRQTTIEKDETKTISE